MAVSPNKIYISTVIFDLDIIRILAYVPDIKLNISAFVISYLDGSDYEIKPPYLYS
jgi:hypothetical protein